MARKCSVCQHPERADMDAAMASGQTTWQVSKAYHVSRDSLRRHAESDHARLFVGKPAAASSALALFPQMTGNDPLVWQRDYLTATGDMLVVKGRQVGASTAAACLCLSVALAHRGVSAVIVSPTLQQSREILGKARDGIRGLDIGGPLEASNASSIMLPGGSRLVSLPGTARSVRGYAADILIIDEAAYVEPWTWEAAQALVAATHGRTIVQSTPAGPVGWMYELAMGGDARWHRITVRSDEVPTIDKGWLAAQRVTLGPYVYASEFEARFVAGLRGLFDPDRLDDMRHEPMDDDYRRSLWDAANQPLDDVPPERKGPNGRIRPIQPS